MLTRDKVKGIVTEDNTIMEAVHVIRGYNQQEVREEVEEAWCPACKHKHTVFAYHQPSADNVLQYADCDCGYVFVYNRTERDDIFFNRFPGKQARIWDSTLKVEKEISNLAAQDILETKILVFLWNRLK